MSSDDAGTWLSERLRSYKVGPFGPDYSIVDLVYGCIIFLLHELGVKVFSKGEVSENRPKKQSLMIVLWNFIKCPSTDPTLGKVLSDVYQLLLDGTFTKKSTGAVGGVNGPSGYYPPCLEVVVFGLYIMRSFDRTDGGDAFLVELMNKATTSLLDHPDKKLVAAHARQLFDMRFPQGVDTEREDFIRRWFAAVIDS